MPLSLTPIDLGAETVALVPARALSWHRVQLPAGTLARGLFAERSAPRLRAVLEGLLEDQLLDEPAQLHFALQPDASDDAPVWVAVCHRQWLQDALTALQQAGHTPQRVVPEWAPDTAARTEGSPPAPRWVTGDADAPQLVWVDHQGVHSWPLPAHQGEAGGTQNHLHSLLPADAELLAEPAVAELAEHLLHRTARVVSPAQRLQGAAQSAWDLAQFELARRNPWLARLAVAADTVARAPQWRPARWAAIALVAVQVLGLNTFAWRAQAQLEQQRLAIRNTLTATFPDITVVVDAPLQMERAAGALRQSSGSASSRDLETLLSALGAPQAQALVGAPPTAMDFAEGELRLTGGSYSPENTAALDAILQTQGLTSAYDGDALVLKARSNTTP